METLTEGMENMIAQGRSNERTAWKESETHVGRFDVRVGQALLPGVVGG